MSKTKVYINLVTGHRVTQDQYEELSGVEKSHYDKISSAKKAKESIAFEYYSEEE